ncbi:MAG: hypothetical protein JNL72_15020 [Flavipsychrobacter sp.]|nr:hypothetical protein [Flavipsychrobacter sp.]
MKYLVFLLAFMLPSLAINAQVIKNYTVDMSATGFKFEQEVPDGFFYTPVKVDFDTDPDIGIMMVPLGEIPAASVEAMRDQYILGMSSDKEAMIEPKKEDMVFGEYRASIVLHSTIKNGKKVNALVAFVSGNNNGLMFVAVDDEKSAYMDKYRATLKTIRMK